ncbi:LAME_0D06546g1_1 [Lachancea meyersii CBS 8951]|uniref:LAME_0D06546g1_1 n=1 Tax=Lachancea meyersii CBS 8951 TaxID=1266667 RepID=A0A1G4J9U6_9SACH|nr:LAME_0D06546g1_1 [Lachancea meyersii CBS 8951]
MYWAISKWLKVFLKCYVNVILYYRNVYPKEAFDWTSFQAFNLPRYMPMNRHPGLQNYIETMVTDVLSKLEAVQHFNLRIIQQDDGACVERYALDFGELRHQDTSELQEPQIFDQLRSSLNSLIARLEKLPNVKPATVTFEIVIDSIGLSLGKKMSRVQNAKERQTQEQDSNWAKCTEEPFLSNPQQSKPRIKLITLTGCDAGPFVIYQFMEMLISNPEASSQVYESSSPFQSSQADPFP